MGIVYNTKSMLFWSFVFFVPPLVMVAFNGGRLSMSREELLATETARRKLKKDEEREEDEKHAMNRVLFEANDSSNGFRQSWAIKRDQERERRRLEREQAKQQES